MKPKWMRNNASCPECGYVIEIEDAPKVGEKATFDCSRCKVHFTGEEFWEAHNDKLAHVWSEHRGESAIREEENE